MIFLDTDLLVRRYGRKGRVLPPAPAPSRYCISDLSRVEFRSAMWRRVRDGALEPAAAEEAIAAFAGDLDRYFRVPLDEGVVRTAEALVKRRPLRSLDALHLASAIVASKEVTGSFRFASADKRLNAAAEAEGLELIAGG